MWNWRKWSDGTAECWGIYVTQQISPWAAWGHIYESGLCSPPNYPAGLFSTVPSTTMVVSGTTGYAAWIGEPPYGSYSGTALNPGQFYLNRGTSPTADWGPVDFSISIDAKGRWK